jgi:hypothetical protein
MGRTIAGTSSLLPQSSAAGTSSKSKEAAIQQQIDAKSAQQARTTCNDTAAKIGKDIAALKSELVTLQATDKGSDKSNGGTPASLASPEAAARQAEFDDEPDTRAVMWA